MCVCVFNNSWNVFDSFCGYSHVAVSAFFFFILLIAMSLCVSIHSKFLRISSTYALMKMSKRTRIHTLLVLVYITYASVGRTHTPPSPTPPPPPKKRSSTWHRHAVDVAATATAIARTEHSTFDTCVDVLRVRAGERVRQRKCVNAFCYGCWQLYNQNKPRHIQLICTCV